MEHELSNHVHLSDNGFILELINESLWDLASLSKSVDFLKRVIESNSLIRFVKAVSEVSVVNMIGQFSFIEEGLCMSQFKDYFRVE